jgi:hypothetical protein
MNDWRNTLDWDIRHKKNPCPECCPDGHGNAYFDLVVLDQTFFWKCRNCGHTVEAQGYEFDYGTDNIGFVWAYELDDDGCIIA